MCGHLIAFHIYLFFRGITTFEHIVYKREKGLKDLELKVRLTSDNDL
jgi:hypothetical protein